MNLIPYPKHLSITGKGGKLSPITERQDPTVPEEGYRISVKTEGTEVFASSPVGFFYAGITLKQLEREKNLPCLSIQDAPKYPHRGFMMDVSRHFFTAEEVKKKIDEISQLKLNVFHWHLTDDQGWRIPIDAYPKLTEIGSVRASTRGDGKEVKGYYTKEEIQDVLAYAKERFVTVIPEIDMPGHFMAAIAAYPYLSCSDKTLSVSESFGIHPEILCGGKESSLDFCKAVLKEVCAMFPAPYIHLGGDEALKLRWIECPHCQKKLTELGLKNEEELQGHILSELVRYVNGLGKKAILWNDGLYGGNVEGDYCVQYWKESKKAKNAAANSERGGKQIIYSPFFCFYLDYPHGMTSLKKTYTRALPDELQGNLIGMEAPLWAEYVDSIDKMDRMIYPRLIAVAERAWSERNNYDKFLSRLSGFLPHWNANSETDYNPRFIKGKLGMIRFFSNALDKTMRENSKYLGKNRRAWKQKYGRKDSKGE